MSEKIIDLIKKSQTEELTSDELYEISSLRFNNQNDKKEIFNYILENYTSLNLKLMNNLFIQNYDNDLFKKYIENCFPDTKYCPLKTIDNIYESLNSNNKENFFIKTVDIFTEEINKIEFSEQHTQSGANHFMVLVKKIKENSTFNMYNPLLDKLFNSFLVSQDPKNVKTVFFKDILNTKMKFISEDNVKNVLFLSHMAKLSIANLTIKPSEIELDILFYTMNKYNYKQSGSLFISLLHSINPKNTEISYDQIVFKYVESLVELQKKPNYRTFKNLKKLLSIKDIQLLKENSQIKTEIKNMLDYTNKNYVLMILNKIEKEIPNVHISSIKSSYEEDILKTTFSGNKNNIKRRM